MIGPCTKQEVRATIIVPDGRRFVGTNFVRNHQPACPRAGMPTGQGYELCRDVCDQAGHAEIIAIQNMGLTRISGGAICFIEGHSYACEKCKEALHEIGVSEIRFEAPPA